MRFQSPYEKAYRPLFATIENADKNKDEMKMWPSPLLKNEDVRERSQKWKTVEHA